MKSRALRIRFLSLAVMACLAAGGLGGCAPGQQGKGGSASMPEIAGIEMNGQQLLAELQEIRSAFRSSNTKQAFNGLFGAFVEPLYPPPGRAPGVTQRRPGAQSLQLEEIAAALEEFLNGKFTSASSRTIDFALDQLITEVSYAALDSFFSQIAEDRAVLTKVKVRVPNLSKLSPEARRSTLNMAAMLMAIKASGYVIDASQKDFDLAKESYRKVVETRNQAAQTLAAAFYTGRQIDKALRVDMARGIKTLQPGDRKFLESLRDLPLDDIVHNPRVAQIALNLLQKLDPVKFKDYSAEFAELRSHYGAYTKTAVGSASMISFSALFVKRAKRIIEKKEFAEGMAVAPMLADCATELVSLAPRIQKNFSSSADMDAGSFSLAKDGKIIGQSLSPRQVFESMGPDGKQALQGQLITGNGILQRMLSLGRPRLAELSDRLVLRDTKLELANEMALTLDDEEVTFANMLDPVKNRDLAKSLAGIYSHRVAVSGAANGQPSDSAKAKVQDQLLNRLDIYTHSDLRWLLIAGSAQSGTAIADPRLTLGGYELRIDSWGTQGLLDVDDLNRGALKIETGRKDDKPTSPKPAAPKPSTQPKV